MLRHRVWIKFLLLSALLFSGAKHSMLAESTRVPSVATVDDLEGKLAGLLPQGEDPEWTWQNPLPQGRSLNGIWGSGPNDVFAIGNSGAILHYDGSSWTTMPTGTRASLNDIWGSGPSDVFVVGYDWDATWDRGGIVLHYDGTSWSVMHSGFPGQGTGIWGTSHNDVFVTSGRLVLHYDGNSWTSTDVAGLTFSLDAVWGNSSNDVFVVGGDDVRNTHGIIHRFDGNTWTKMDSDRSGPLSDVYGISSDDVFAVGQYGIRHYDGSAWSEMDSGFQSSLSGTWSSSSDNVFAVGREGTILNYDGNTWDSISASIEVDLNAIWGSDSSNIFAVGYGGVILHFDGNDWRAMSQSASYSTLNEVWGRNESDVFAVGNNGTILHYDHNEWRAMVNEDTHHLNDVWGSGSNNVFAVGNEGTILRYDGSGWSEMSSGTSHYIEGVWGSSSTDVFAVGGGWNSDAGEPYCMILHYDGERWSEIGHQCTDWLRDVWGSGPNDVFALGSDLILHYDGETWMEMDIGDASYLEAIWGSGHDDVFAVGRGGTILHYDGSGWTEMESNTTSSLYDISGSGPDHVFAIGGSNPLHYDGNKWSETTGGWYGNGVWVSSLGDAFAVGSGGSILHFESDPQGMITGNVARADSGSSLANVVIMARTYSTTTDLSGNYTLMVPPGVYTVKATPDTAMDCYANQRSFITVDDGETVTVDLKLTPITSETVDTVILANPQRMKDIGFNATSVDELMVRLNELQTTHPERTNMTAILVDLGAGVSSEIDAAYATWHDAEGYVSTTNALVDSIDSYVEGLKQGDYPNLRYVVIVGSHEVIPMKARAADSPQEKAWAEEEGSLPRKSGYVYEIYSSDFESEGGYYLTDSQYGDLSYVSSAHPPGCDSELIPELHVGRLVETPQQIVGLIDAYLASQGVLSKDGRVAIASIDQVDAGTLAAEYMGPTADAELVEACFASESVVEKLNANPNLVFLAGHSSYYTTLTCKRHWVSNDYIDAGPSTEHASVQDVTVNLPGTTIVSVGCHNGLNLGNKLYQPPSSLAEHSDFPEELARKKVAVFFGSTGLAKGSNNGEDTNPSSATSTEKLAAKTLDYIIRNRRGTAGEALKDAINAYVSEQKLCGDLQNHVLGIYNLYGIPNYRYTSSQSALVMDSEGHSEALQTASSTASMQNWTVEMDFSSWSLSDGGVVTLPGASYTEDINTPILPVVSFRRLLPAGSSIRSITWHEDASESLTITNDIPLPVIGMPAIGYGEGIVETGTFTHTSPYPAVPYFSNDVTDAGGGTWVSVQVVPVQYDQTTHTTRIWTYLSLEVEYAGGDSTDSDGDGLPDYWERGYGLDPANDSGDSGADADIDGDGLSNAEEFRYSTNPKNPDTDGDGSPDGIEILLGIDPNNPFSKPATVFLPVVAKF